MVYGKAPAVDVVIDIETIVVPPTPQDIEDFKKNWRPKGNAKLEATIEKQKEEAFADVEKTIVDSRKFALGGKKMICAALGTISPTSQSVIDIESWASDDLSKITTGIVEYLNGFADYNLVGWNHKGFDLPELAKSFFKTGVRPKRKPSKWGIIDLWAYPFDKKSLKDTAKAFGLEVMDVSGADIANLHEQGEWDKIKEYNEYDVELTGRIYLAASTIFTF